MKQTHRRPQPYYLQVWDVFCIELTNWRWSWRQIVMIGTVTPLIGMLGFSVFARDSGPVALQYVWSGNIVIGLLFGLQNNIASHFVYLRLEGALSYFATLPIRKSALLLAIITAFFLLNLPSILATIFVGAWMLDISIQPSWLLIIIIPLCAIPMAGIGAFIGSRARNYQEAGAINLAIMLLMTALGPVVIPPDRLPNFMVTLGRFSPATYAASALRGGLLSDFESQIWIDLSMLIVFSLVVIASVNWALDWRER